MTSPGTIILTAVLASFIAYTHQLKCFDCYEGGSKSLSKDVKAPCGNYSEDLVVTCNSDVQVCIKLVTDAGSQSNSLHSCGSTAAFCDQLSSKADDVSVSCYSCDSDKCNGASTLAAATSLVTSLALVFYHVYFT